MEDHSSWDQSCPEFLRKSTHLDKLHPENALTYFLTKEEWMQSARPERIPIDSRFPAKFAVGGLPPLGYTEKQRTDKVHKCKSKRRGAQGTLDNYVKKQVRFTNNTQILNEDEAEEVEAVSLIQEVLWN